MGNLPLVISKFLLLALVIVVSVAMVIIAIRQINISEKKMTAFRKLKKSLIFGCGVNSLLLMFFFGIQILFWDGSLRWINLSALLIFGACFLIPVQVIGTIGGFVQITYLEFLARQTKG
jgi:hypothetical protein